MSAKKTDNPDYPMNLDEAAEYAGLSRRSIQHHTALGHLRAYRHAGGGKWHRWYRSDLDDFIKAHPAREAS